MDGVRIKQLRTMRNLSQSDLAQEFKVAQNTVSKWERGDREPDYDTLRRLAEFFGVTIDFLLHRQGNLDTINTDKVAGNENRRIPIASSIKKGNDGLLLEILEENILVDQDELKGNIIGFKCKDDSMEGIGIYKGDIALVQRQKEIESGNVAVLIVDEEEAFLRRVHYDANGDILLEAANSHYPPRMIREVDKDRAIIVGKVIEVRKKF